jgi:hypothetical protein
MAAGTRVGAVGEQDEAGAVRCESRADSDQRLLRHIAFCARDAIGQQPEGRCIRQIGGIEPPRPIATPPPRSVKGRTCQSALSFAP